MKKTLLNLLFAFFAVSNIVMAQNTDVITAKDLPAKAGSYSPFEQLTFQSGAKYSGKTAKDGNSIRLSNKKETYPGIVITSSDKQVKSIAIKWSANSEASHDLHVYGKNFKYYNTSDLYKGKAGTNLCVIMKGNNSVIDLSGQKVKYIGLLAEDGTIHIDTITINWCKSLQNLRFEKTAYEATIGKDFIKPQLFNAKNTIKYSSSNPEIATVDENKGDVTLNGVGTATITATSEETESYERESVNYTLTVLPLKYDFKNPVLYGYTNDGSKWDVNVTRSLTLPDNDVVVTVTAGSDGRLPRFYTDKNNFTGLRIYPGGSITFTVPEGIDFSKVDMDCYYKNEKPICSQPSPNCITYFVPETSETEVCVASASPYYIGDSYLLRIGNTNHATFSARRPYVMPQGVKGGIVTVNTVQNTAQVDYKVFPGDVVAPGTALLLKAKQGIYHLTHSVAAGVSFDENQNSLRPATTSDVINAPVDRQLFILANKNQLGFYWQTGSVKGNSVKNIANKAYLEVPVGSGVYGQGFRLELGENTGISQSAISEKEEKVVYDLLGKRVNLPIKQLTRGIYLINGQKVLIK